MRTLTRRDFLKLSGAATLGLPFRLPPDEDPPPSSPIGLGRATRALKCYDQPSFSAKELKVHGADTVLTIYEKKDGDTGTSHNPIWFRVDEGWVHSSLVQPVRNDLNPPLLTLPAGGFLGEVTVPFANAWHTESDHTRVAYRFYYSSTHWVDQVVTDEKGSVWYRVFDDRYQVYYFILAKHLRRVLDEELTPLAPKVLDKRIEVDLKRQKLNAYENGSLVFAARLSSGRPGTETPTGAFRVERKRPSRHMAANDAGGNGFDLPGVPWVSYISWMGVAFHGTYWHNGFGHPRSRGCLNLTPADAKWIYRWTLPVVPPGKSFMQDKSGTEVIVF